MATSSLRTFRGLDTEKCLLVLCYLTDRLPGEVAEVGKQEQEQGQDGQADERDGSSGQV